ncbi:hypothetical protein GALL_243290 [mine drainage metagenome]|uniref:Recombinase domain-containing protein n=1 Tax=mine drainage metagenome TaxID=410659 RepID=A0A1J5RD77_9ZZZZ
MTDEECLWGAVLRQALLDAVGLAPDRNSSGKSANVATQAEARRWIRHGGADFEAVCLAAGFEPAKVQQAAERAMTTGAAPASIARKPTVRTVDADQQEREGAITALWREGLNSVQIAARLDGLGLSTKKGGRWRSNTVREALNRLGMCSRLPPAARQGWQGVSAS